MPFDVLFNSVFDMLTTKGKRLGAAAQSSMVSSFVQATHSGAQPQFVVDPKRPNVQWALPGELHAKVLGGFCNGASLDWLRKVLQREDGGGRNQDYTHLKASRVMRMAQTQVALGQLNSVVRASVAPDRARADALSEQADRLGTDSAAAYDRAKKMLKDWVIQNNGTWTDGPTIQASMNEGATPEAKALFDQKWAQLIAAMSVRRTAMQRQDELEAEATQLRTRANAKIERLNAAGTFATRGELWDELVKSMGTDAGKKRPFSNICPVANNPQGATASFRDFLISALSTPAFSPGRGMQISLSLDPGPGHAIALCREVGGSVHMFDPNLGVYRFKDHGFLVMALFVLAELGYAGTDPDGTVTRLGSSPNWQVFAKATGGPPSITGPALMTADDVRVACDQASDIIESATMAAEADLHDKLTEAQDLWKIYEKSKTRSDRVSWHNAHNDAVIAFKRVRGQKLVDAQRTYPKLTPQQQDWTEQ